MINEHDILIQKLKEKVQIVISRTERAKSEKQVLLSEIDLLKEKMKTLEQENSELSEKYENLKLAKTISVTSNESHDAKIKINRIIREIDKCISQLNK